MAYDDQLAQKQRSLRDYENAAATVRPASLRENIAEDLGRARANVARLEELAKLIDENPSTSRILELMGQR